MDKNAIKKYAVWARRELISRVSQRAALYGITEKNSIDANVESINGKVLTLSEKKERRALIDQINAKGYQEVMEEVAYTWFNRFIALRFMEVNGYLPSHIRVFADDENAFNPQILAEAINLDFEGLDMEKVFSLKNADDDEALYKYLIIAQCNALNECLPRIFQKIDDYTELLFPDNILREGSVIERMIAMIPEDNWTDQVQIIGWLYQYYNSEKKDDVFAALKKNVKITKENIPAATQLFTPDWIVRYMVENSLGRLWLEGHPNTREQLLPTEEEQKAYIADHSIKDEKWHYYLEEAEQEPEVQAQLAEIRKEYAKLEPEDIKVIDPCCGSGHILAYMFDVLVKIYESHGYITREAVRSIVENNIYGLDIDDRAAQLAYFSVMMKGRQYDSRFLKRGVQPNVYAIVESNHVDRFALEYFCNGDAKLTKAMKTIITELHDAKEYGSILTVTQQDWSALYTRFDEIDDDIAILKEQALAMLPIVQAAEALAQKYHIVVTNPPYMGASNMNPKLNQFIKNKYADYKSDFFSAFVIHASKMTKKDGYCGFFTPYVWMFIKSYGEMRNYLYNYATFETLIQFEYSAFEEATVPVCTFTFKNNTITGKKGCYLRLTGFRGGMEVQRQKTLEAISNHYCGFYFEQCADNFTKIPGSPVAYWVSKNLFEDFRNGTQLSKIAEPKSGLSTTDNNRFLRLWFEPDINNISFDIDDISQTSNATRWFPIAKGGEYRKWYGNNDYVVNWWKNGLDIKEATRGAAGGRIVSPEYYFKRFVTWSGISSGEPSMRISDRAIFGSGAKALISDYGLYDYLAFLNSKVALNILQFLSPTLNYEAGHIGNMPICFKHTEYVTSISNSCIELSENDWDSFETSWDFKRHPLLPHLPLGSECILFDGDGKQCSITHKSTHLADEFEIWSKECNERFNKLKANEEELNRIFIDIYGLQDELTPEVEDKDVTIRKADLQRDIKSLISYAVGCMFGRYSLDVEGLAYAGGEWDASKYSKYPVDADNIIPICDDEYFADDIVNRFLKFLEVVYGMETLEDNIRFIADALGGKGQPRDVIRNYFLNDFYSDHLKTYQKRPIYWLFDSGKKNGFKCLIYMHRYQPDTIARIRTDYIHEQQSRYRTAIENLESRIASASNSEKVKLNKQMKKLTDQAEEVRVYEEKIHHLADQMISIDLDDGVKVNYAKFQDVLAKIK